MQELSIVRSEPVHVLSIISVMALGFVLGIRHATDPDHVIAVSTIVTRYRSMRDAAWIGSLWGIGHTFTIMIVGGGIVLLGWAIPVRLGLSMEFSVGLMLVLLGILNLTGFLQWINENVFANRSALRESSGHCDTTQPPVAPTPHESHSHKHSHSSVKWLDRHLGRLGVYQISRPIVIGVVHGLAGSAAIALLVLATIHDPFWAISYLGFFGVGTIAGMMVITAAIAIPFACSARFPININSGFRFASGLISLSFGIFVVYQIVIVGGLFSAHPHWTPR